MSTRLYGVQLFSIPHLLDNDFKGTLELISKIGYKEVEFFGPYPFSAAETIQQWEGFKGQLGLKNNAFYGYTVKETAQLLDDLGLTAPSIHADLPSLRHQLSAFAESVAVLQSKYIVLPALMEGRSSLDDYKRLAVEFNQIGKQLSSDGMTFVYHNHGYEHAEMEGVIPMDYLLQHTNPDYVQFELDIFWMSAAGGDPIHYLKSYPNRFKLLHLKNATKQFRFAGDGSTPDQWMAVFPNMADPHDGVFDIPAIIAQAEASGAEHFFLERDLAPEPLKTLRDSFEYLSGIQ